MPFVSSAHIYWLLIVKDRVFYLTCSAVLFFKTGYEALCSLAAEKRDYGALSFFRQPLVAYFFLQRRFVLLIPSILMNSTFFVSIQDNYFP